MNREHIAKVRDALKVLAETGKSPVGAGFDMGLWQTVGCETACCLRGWSELIAGGPLASWPSSYEVPSAYALSRCQERALFEPQGEAALTENPAHGVAMLDWLLEQPDDVSPDAIAAKWAEVAP